MRINPYMLNMATDAIGSVIRFERPTEVAWPLPGFRDRRVLEGVLELRIPYRSIEDLKKQCRSLRQEQAAVLHLPSHVYVVDRDRRWHRVAPKGALEVRAQRRGDWAWQAQWEAAVDRIKAHQLRPI